VDWYQLPKEAQQPLWSEPYFDDGGGNVVMTTYSMPFRRGEQFWGIATIDIAMTQLVARAAEITPAKSGYAFIVSKQGRFLAYPDESKIMKGTITEATKSSAGGWSLARMASCAQLSRWQGARLDRLRPREKW
jgi:sigma-B regulation protein RsbU (phosphoserine phosphatase)